MARNAAERPANPVVVISANAAWNLVNFRSNLISGLIADGFDLVGAAPADDEAQAALAALGCRFHAVPVDSAGLSPRRDVDTFRAYLRLFRAERPVAYLGFTIKPNVYGSLAAARCGVPAVNNISGLGTAFIKKTWLTPLVEQLYRLSLARARVVFFQNEDDRGIFVGRKLVRAAVTRMLPGSGVDLSRFTPSKAVGERRGDPFTFLLIARLLRDKGVLEYVEAARRLRAEGKAVRFQILGFLGAANLTAISREDVDAWVAEGAIDYLGPAADVRPFIAAADCVVLPSYREGTSRVLLEAAAMARPIVATDVPGCREVVDDGVSGYLCAVRDAADLAAKMAQVAALEPKALRDMGAAGRAKVERDYDERIVIDAYRSVLEDVRRSAA